MSSNQSEIPTSLLPNVGSLGGLRRKIENVENLPVKKRRYAAVLTESSDSLDSSVNTEGLEKQPGSLEYTSRNITTRIAVKGVIENCISPSPTSACSHYTDRSNEKDDDPLTPLTPFGSTPNFPAKMYAMLANPMLNGIAEWLPHGRSWRIVDQKQFEKSILPIFFDHAKFSSFVRQANGWGFRRINSGPDKNSYYHEYFLRGLPHLCKKLFRPGRSKKAHHGFMDAPDLYKISELHPLPEDAVPDEAVLLLSTIRNGPKAKVPVAYRLDSSNANDAELTISSSSAALPVPMTREILENLLPVNKNPSESSLSTKSTSAEWQALSRETPARQSGSLILPKVLQPQPPQSLECYFNTLTHLVRSDSNYKNPGI